MISVRQCVILCCCLLLASAGCRSQAGSSGNSQQSAQQSSSQSTATNSNAGAAAQNLSNQNSGNVAVTTTASVAADPCSLLTRAEIQSVQGDEVKETKRSPGSGSRFTVSQCFYQTASFNKSVSLELTSRATGRTDAPSPRKFWEEHFEREGEDKEREGEREEEEKGDPPKPVTGVGDEAFWVGNRVAGALYVLSNDSIIRISVGGEANQDARIEKTKALALIAVKRLKD